MSLFSSTLYKYYVVTRCPTHSNGFQLFKGILSSKKSPNSDLFSVFLFLFVHAYKKNDRRGRDGAERGSANPRFSRIF